MPTKPSNPSSHFVAADGKRQADLQALSVEFGRRLRDGIVKARDVGYDTTTIENMLRESDPVALAKKLIASSSFQGGPKEMAKLGHKELTIEAIMLEEQFRPLFSGKEIEAATWRFAQL